MAREVARRTPRDNWRRCRRDGVGISAKTAPVAERILFITATRIGDAVLSTGLLDHLLRTRPGARFTIACGPAAEGVFARMPRRDRTIILVKRGLARHWRDLWLATVATRWDLVVDLRASALAWTLAARARAVARGGRLPGHRLAHLGTVLGLAPAPAPVAWWGQADADRAVAALPAEGVWIGLGPTANWAPKAWAPERFAALFDRLVAADGPLPGARAALFGGAGAAEAALAAPLAAALGDRAIDLVGRLTLPEAAAALARCALFVGNDSGLMHLAAAAGTPTLGLFGPSRVDEYGPVGARVAAAVAPGSPDPHSMPHLGVDAAFAAARDLLRARP